MTYQESRIGIRHKFIGKDTVLLLIFIHGLLGDPVYHLIGIAFILLFSAGILLVALHIETVTADTLQGIHGHFSICIKFRAIPNIEAHCLIRDGYQFTVTVGIRI